MKQPVLVVMAAGMGSRYGGLKQIDPVGPDGQIILDYSLFDAYRAGFRKVIFVIKKELTQAFEDAIGARARARMAVEYAYQSTDRLPGGLPAPAGREKPFGTGHAVWSVRGLVNEPFAVINADDYYGAEAFQLIYDRLCALPENPTEPYPFAMVGYRVGNTLTENGTVSRGVCTTDGDGFLQTIVEREQIARQEDGTVAYLASDTWIKLPESTVVSMNLWGFPPCFLDELDAGFHRFYRDNLPANPLKAEYYLPAGVDALVQSGRARVQVLTTEEKWYGVTYQQDKAQVMQALAQMTRQGNYPAARE